MIETSSTSSEVEEGNTSLSSTSKQVSPAKYWAFTLNNYEESDIIELKNLPSSKVPRLVFQPEIGENGVPHLQGALMYKTKGRPFGLVSHRRYHWRKMYTKSTPKQMFDYACKKDTRSGEAYCRGWEPPYELALKLYPWQESISDTLYQEPDDRKIHWIWEPDGGVGKTTFQKWIFANHDRCVVLSGKGADMKNGIIQYQDKKGTLPNIVLINVPRTSVNFVSFTGIEEIKDMFFFSGKYEGGMVCGKSPHVFIFANSEPDTSKMSADRWVIKRIVDRTLV